MPDNLKVFDAHASFVRFLSVVTALVIAGMVAACTPFDLITTFGPDAAYTASEDRSVDDVWDDNVLKLSLNKALLDESAALFKDVGTVVYEGRVLLIGAVETVDARRRAVSIVRRHDGVRSVVKRIQVTDEGGLIAYAKDVAIEKKIQAELLFDSDINSANLRVRSVNRTVYLFGAAADKQEIDRVLAVVRDVDDVRDVDNLMWLRKVAPHTPTAAR